MKILAKEYYDKGNRCRGVCNICKDFSECYQAKAQGYFVIDDKVVNKRDLNPSNTKESKVQCEIEDLETGCTYIKTGKTIEECIEDFNSFFLFPHKHNVLWQKELR